MKRSVCVLVLLCALLNLVGCSASENDSEQAQIVCTIFPVYDWIREIVGDCDVQVDLLADNGTDLHSYQPSVKDIMEISQSDVFFYVGGESDGWVEDTAENLGDKCKSYAVMDFVQTVEEETVEGMQGETEEEAETDEHIWLSITNAVAGCEGICQALCQAYPQYAEAFTENMTSYTQDLKAMDQDFREKLSTQAVRNDILVADRFPFRYLAEDYDLQYYAAFSGCSAETEASFYTIEFLAEKAVSEQLPCLLLTESGTEKLADTISETAGENFPVKRLNTMQSVTRKQLQAGMNYKTEMQQNLEVLLWALTEA